MSVQFTTGTEYCSFVCVHTVRFILTGKDWFNMPALELTEERKNDLELLQMRGALDPKRYVIIKFWTQHGL
jgi:Fcf2 pre-rRNA processing